jgi:pimeloyl-ACP methyl ester carboxylesterase
MDIVLLAGLWLPQSIWTEVNAELKRLGHRPIAPTMPGVDDGSMTATLTDQLEAVLAAADVADRPIVVGHSAACTLAWMVADRRPGAIGQVVLIGGFPASDGDAYADFFPIDGGVMPFPGWEPFEGADAADLDADDRDRIAAMTVPVPEGVARGKVTYDDDGRFGVPTLLICPEFSPDQAKEWIGGGEAPELSGVRSLDFADIDSGHWPMVTRPAELAGILDSAARGPGRHI